METTVQHVYEGWQHDWLSIKLFLLQNNWMNNNFCYKWLWDSTSYCFHIWNNLIFDDQHTSRDTPRRTRCEHLMHWLTTIHLDQSSHRLPDLCLIHASDSRVKYEWHSLYYNSMVISSIKHLHMLCSTSFFTTSFTLRNNSRWEAHVSGTRCERPRASVHTEEGKRITCKTGN